MPVSGWGDRVSLVQLVQSAGLSSLHMETAAQGSFLGAYRQPGTRGLGSCRQPGTRGLLGACRQPGAPRHLRATMRALRAAPWRPPWRRLTSWRSLYRLCCTARTCRGPGRIPAGSLQGHSVPSVAAHLRSFVAPCLKARGHNMQLQAQEWCRREGAEPGSPGAPSVLPVQNSAPSSQAAQPSTEQGTQELAASSRR